ncbi:hypothetical protein ES703_54634 [subsurface metagenome]
MKGKGGLSLAGTIFKQTKMGPTSFITDSRLLSKLSTSSKSCTLAYPAALAKPGKLIFPTQGIG